MAICDLDSDLWGLSIFYRDPDREEPAHARRVSGYGGKDELSGITPQPQKIKCFDCVIYWEKQCPDCKLLMESSEFKEKDP